MLTDFPSEEENIKYLKEVDPNQDDQDMLVSFAKDFLVLYSTLHQRFILVMYMHKILTG